MMMVFGFLKRNKPPAKPEADTNGIMIACIPAMHAMALADGNLSPAEKSIIIEITSAYKRGLMPPQEILQLVEQTMAMMQAGSESDRAGFFARFSSASGEDKKLVLGAAASIALADDQLHIEEQALLAKLALWMNMHDSDFKEWTREFDALVAERCAKGTLTIAGKLQS